MRTNFINLLTGTTDDLKQFPVYNTYVRMWKEDDLVRETRRILGTKDERWALIVAKITLADHYLDLTSSIREGLPDVENMALLGGNTKLLVADANGAASTHPVEIAGLEWPVKNDVRFEWLWTDTYATIDFNHERWIVPAHYKDDRLYVKWPKELGISGALQIEEMSTILHLQLNLRYPIKVVVEQLAASPPFYKLTEAIGRTHDFFFADSDHEKIGIAALAMAAYIDKNNDL